MELKKIFTNWKIILFIVVLLLAILMISPNPWNEGAAIRFVEKNSSAWLAGIESPGADSTPMSKEKIVSVNNQLVKNARDYYDFVENLPPNTSFTLQTTDGFYRLTTRPLYNITYLNETEFKEITKEILNESSNETINVTETIEVQKFTKEVIGTEDIGLTVYDAPTNNIRKGLDLSGGTRVLLEPEEKISSEDLSLVVDNIKERLNVYGLSDITVRVSKDLEGKSFIRVEIAGANNAEVRDLLAKQGKFEAKIGNTSIFRGGQDINYVCNKADCERIETCGSSPDGISCRFSFSIILSKEAAQRQANKTKDLPIQVENGDTYLSESLDLYLDDELVDSLRIGSELKGNAVTDIAISGSGSGKSEPEAVQDTLNNMKRLKTILVTGSLPVKLKIVKTNSISPLFGAEFIKNALLIAILAIAAVAIVVFVIYRKLSISLPMVFVLLAEIIIMLGVSAFIRRDLDLAAIAGIIIAIGTSVDHQIVIADEIMKGRKINVLLSWIDRIKSAFFIIMAAYFTTMAAMIPLLFAGAGILEGFAIMTMIGVTVGVLITRPAYAALVQVFYKEDK